MDSDVRAVGVAALAALPYKVATYGQSVDAMLAALGANGYVVVPRDALSRFMTQADFMAIRSQEGTYAKRQYDVARAAVVEAVGPTREDQR